MTLVMASCPTKYFGHLDYDEASALQFAHGLPGFEEERRFLAIEHPATAPLVYLQSLATADLCFVSLPAHLVDADYRMELAEEDRLELGAGEGLEGLLCLALLTIRETGTTANLLAPVVANPATRRAVQAINGSGRYSHQAPIEAAAEARC